MQDAQKGHGSHPPNPGAPRRAVPQARPQRAKRRRRTLRYVELLSEARTTLADFFSILLVVRAYEGESIVSRRAEKRSAGQLC